MIWSHWGYSHLMVIFLKILHAHLSIFKMFLFLIIFTAQQYQMTRNQYLIFKLKKNYFNVLFKIKFTLTLLFSKDFIWIPTNALLAYLSSLYNIDLILYFFVQRLIWRNRIVFLLSMRRMNRLPVRLNTFIRILLKHIFIYIRLIFLS